MKYYVIMDELTEIEQRIVSQLEDWKSQLNDVCTEMENYVQCLEDNGSGELVEEIKRYIRDVHIEKLPKQFLLVIEEIIEKIKTYTKGYCEIEINWKEGKIAQESLEEQQMVFQEVSFDLVEKTDEVEVTLNEISDIIGKPVMSTALIEAGLRTVSAKIEALKQTIGESEETHKESDFVTMEELMSILEGMIGKYTNENVIGVGSYENQDILQKEKEDSNKKHIGRYPVEYIEGIIKKYEKHAMINGRFVLDNGGQTIAYGHDVLEGEDFSNGLSEQEGLELAIKDLDKKYDSILAKIEELNAMRDENGNPQYNINIDDFSENEIIFLVDFAYNRGNGLVQRPELKEAGEPNQSLTILIIAVSEKDDKKIMDILMEETLNLKGEYLEGLKVRRLDQYEIYKFGEYERDDDIERDVTKPKE